MQDGDDQGPLVAAHPLGCIPQSFVLHSTLVLRVHESALKRRYTRDDVSHAIDMALYEADFDLDNDPPKVLLIGPDLAGNLLELFGGVIENGDLLIWHAMPCRAEYLDLLPKSGGDA